MTSVIINYQLQDDKKKLSRFVSETMPEEFFSMELLCELVRSLRMSYGVKVICLLIEKPSEGKYRVQVYYTLPLHDGRGRMPKDILLIANPRIWDQLKNQKNLPMRLYEFKRKPHVNGSIKTVREYLLSYYDTELYTDLWVINLIIDSSVVIDEVNHHIIKELATEFNETNRKKNKALKNVELSLEEVLKRRIAYVERCRRRDQKALAEANAAEVHC